VPCETNNINEFETRLDFDSGERMNLMMRMCQKVECGKDESRI
jgi:hypothetical protein|tara:strand:+ start:108 stop:236 length:129 start_codon:yes stop_codon:yes gene_type:complete